jgi:hypothetical protein
MCGKGLRFLRAPGAFTQLGAETSRLELPALVARSTVNDDIFLNGLPIVQISSVQGLRVPLLIPCAYSSPSYGR